MHRPLFIERRVSVSRPHNTVDYECLSYLKLKCEFNYWAWIICLSDHWQMENCWGNLKTIFILAILFGDIRNYTLQL